MSDSADPMPTTEDATRRRRLCLHYWEVDSAHCKQRVAIRARAFSYGVRGEGVYRTKNKDSAEVQTTRAFIIPSWWESWDSWECGRRDEGGMKGQRTLVVSHVPARRVSKHASARSTNDGYSIVPSATDGVPARKPMMGTMTSGEWMTVDANG